MMARIKKIKLTKHPHIQFKLMENIGCALYKKVANKAISIIV